MLLYAKGLRIGERVKIKIDAADYARVGIHRGNWRENVTDRATGTRYRLRGASCGLPGCMCDAAVVRVLTASAD